MSVIAAVTIGQAPRDDVVPEMRALVPEAEWIQAGALDGLDRAALDRLAPSAADFPLVTRLSNGRSVVVGERAVLPCLQAAVRRLEPAADLVIVLCSGTFDLQSAVPLIFPGRVLAACVSSFQAGTRLAVLTPLAAQVDAQRERWTRLGMSPSVHHADPYGATDFDAVGRAARAAGAQLIVLDCIGYTGAMRAAVQAASGLPALLARTVAARLAAELVVR